MSRPVLYGVTRAERAAEVQRLRAQGLKRQEITAQLGISYAYLNDLLWDPDGSKLRERAARYRGTCEDCGGPTSNGNNTKAPKVCDACYRTRHAAKHGTRSKYQAGCSCEDCRRANRDATRALKGQTPPQHGVSGYQNYGCRCRTCRKAHLVYERKRADYYRAWRASKKGQEPPSHGTLYAYSVFGCRCESCRDAMRQSRRRRQAA